jgi:hypothetical protein
MFLQRPDDAPLLLRHRMGMEQGAEMRHGRIPCPQQFEGQDFLKISHVNVCSF